MFFTGAAKVAPTAPPTNTSKICQSTDENDDFVDGIIGGAIVLGMIVIIYACHSCNIRFCRNRRDNAGAILNLPNMVQLPSQFPIGPPFLHKDDGISRGVARIFQRGGHRGYLPDYIWFIPLLFLVYQRAQSYYRGMKAHINQRQEPLTKILYKKTNFKKVGFSTMAFTANIL